MDAAVMWVVGLSVTAVLGSGVCTSVTCLCLSCVCAHMWHVSDGLCVCVCGCPCTVWVCLGCGSERQSPAARLRAAVEGRQGLADGTAVRILGGPMGGSPAQRKCSSEPALKTGAQLPIPKPNGSHPTHVLHVAGGDGLAMAVDGALGHDDDVQPRPPAPSLWVRDRVGSGLSTYSEARGQPIQVSRSLLPKAWARRKGFPETCLVSSEAPRDGQPRDPKMTGAKLIPWATGTRGPHSYTPSQAAPLCV